MNTKYTVDKAVSNDAIDHDPSINSNQTNTPDDINKSNVSSTACADQGQATPYISYSPENTLRLCKVLSSLSNPGRLSILMTLMSRKEVRVSDLVSGLKMRQPAVSQHLARLKEDGIISCERRGKSVYYWIQDMRAPIIVAKLSELYDD